jgi:hypothetical protein
MGPGAGRSLGLEVSNLCNMIHHTGCKFYVNICKVDWSSSQFKHWKRLILLRVEKEVVIFQEWQQSSGPRYVGHRILLTAIERWKEFANLCALCTYLYSILQWKYRVGFVRASLTQALYERSGCLTNQF